MVSKNEIREATDTCILAAAQGMAVALVPINMGFGDRKFDPQEYIWFNQILMDRFQTIPAEFVNVDEGNTVIIGLVPDTQIYLWAGADKHHTMVHLVMPFSTLPDQMNKQG